MPTKKSADKSKVKNGRQGGEKFSEVYDVAASQIYKTDDAEKLLIPGSDHFLYDQSSPLTFDELKVRQIDADGHFSTVIEVWTDRDTKKLWVVDGRESVLNVREVNRRRRLEGRQPVILSFKPYSSIVSGDTATKDAVAHLVVKNFHRRLPTPSVYALNILTLVKAGWHWDKIVECLHVEVEGAEKWCRARLPLAFCIPEVRAAFDAGKIPLSKAKSFGGGMPDGSEALGKTHQKELLDDLLAPKEKADKPPRQMPVKAREKIAHAMTNGASASLTFQDKTIAEGVAAGLALASGDTSALDRWPDLAKIATAALLAKAKREEVEE